MKFKHGYIVVLKAEPWPKTVLHFCGYEELPSGEYTKQDRIDLLIEELSTDEEFGLTCKIDECDITEASQEQLEYYSTIFPNEIEPQLKETNDTSPIQ